MRILTSYFEKHGNHARKGSAIKSLSLSKSMVTMHEKHNILRVTNRARIGRDLVFEAQVFTRSTFCEIRIRKVLLQVYVI